MLNLNKYKEIQIKIQEASARLIAVSKKQPTSKIRSLYEEGHRDFGENFVQELNEKQDILKDLEIRWHYIGALQSNKVNKVVGRVDYIHSVHSLELAQRIHARAQALDLVQKVLIQINVSGESTKSGISKEEFFKKESEFFSLSHIKICGFMTMPPLTGQAEDSRLYFKKLKEIQLHLNAKYDFVRELSMGTTQDYREALEEGATMIRVGEAVFGSRN